MSVIEEINKRCRQPCQQLGGVFYYLPQVSDFQKKEINFHQQIYQEEEEIHQLASWRNRFYHQYFKKWLLRLPPSSLILEIGAGSGFDLSPLLERGYRVITSDISQDSVIAIKEKFNGQYPDQLGYLVADGGNLPFADNAVEASFMVAAFHHLENPAKALAEIKRVTTPDGLIILAMEPSKFMRRFTGLFSNYKKLRVHHGYSVADETHSGFSRADFIEFGLPVLKIKRVWLLLGFVHYGLEALFRLFKLKKRITMPLFFEWLLLVLDEVLLQVPLINRLNWHWIVVLKVHKYRFAESAGRDKPGSQGAD